MNKHANNADIAHVLITGGTGFIGSALAERLLRLEIPVSVLSRDRKKALAHFAGRVGAVESLHELDPHNSPDVIINLAGKNLGEQRWNHTVKRQLIESRVNTTEKIVEYVAQAESRPKLLISGSAVGYYGARGDEVLEEGAEASDEFQSELCQRWEEAANQAQQYGVRVCISRTGVVIGPHGGALSGLLPLFSKGLGAVAGTGEQWLSWIHMQDLLNIFVGFMQDSSLSGPFNNTAPNPVTNRQFAEAIGRALHRPVMLRSPVWAMRLLYGEMAHLYLSGQRVIPARHLQSGFVYRYPDIDSALTNVLQAGS